MRKQKSKRPTEHLQLRHECQIGGGAISTAPAIRGESAAKLRALIGEGA
jgi:hypothetical protein